MKTFAIQYVEEGQIIWMRGKKEGILCGITSTEFAHDGTLKKIRSALVNALAELDAQISLSLDHID